MNVTIKSHDCIINKHENCNIGYSKEAEEINPFNEPITFCLCECHK